jgi:hypothetical protein
VSDTKTCVRCQTDLPIASFESTKGGTRSVCRPCHLATNRQQRSTGYEPYLTNLVSKSKSSRVKRGFSDYAVTAEYLAELWRRQDGRCAISGVVLTHHNDGSGPKDFNASIDRIDSQLGYIPGNVQLVALRVNLLKQSLSNDMLYWWVKTIYQYSCD